MIKKFPIIRPVVSLRYLIESLRYLGESDSAKKFSQLFLNQFRAEGVFLFNSGLAAFYAALGELKKSSTRQEVILPAYTAGSLVVAIKKAGLKPVLVDITLDDFNLDRKILPKVISQNTLAVVVVHMFGIPIKDISGLKQIIPPEVCLLEDCAQGQGAKVDNQLVGSFGELSFFSFNRGKNFSLFGGGALVVYNYSLAQKFADNFPGLKIKSGLGEFFLVLKMFLSLAATHPQVYGLVNSLIACFKENAPPDDFVVAQLSGLQAGMGVVLASSREKIFQQRNWNGEYLREGLKSVLGIRLAEISPNCYPVYNRFPVLFEDTKILECKQKQLWKAGFESSRMYLKPLPKMFELGYSSDDFPNANYLAEHILTLPVYPSLGEKELAEIIEVIKQ